MKEKHNGVVYERVYVEINTNGGVAKSVPNFYYLLNNKAVRSGGFRNRFPFNWHWPQTRKDKMFKKIVNEIFSDVAIKPNEIKVILVEERYMKFIDRYLKCFYNRRQKTK